MHFWASVVILFQKFSLDYKLKILFASVQEIVWLQASKSTFHVMRTPCGRHVPKEAPHHFLVAHPLTKYAATWNI